MLAVYKQLFYGFGLAKNWGLMDFVQTFSHMCEREQFVFFFSGWFGELPLFIWKIF